MLASPICRGHRAVPPAARRVLASRPSTPWPRPRGTQLLLPAVALAVRRAQRQVATICRGTTVEQQPMALAFTENGALALESSNNACVDFMFLVVPGIPTARLYSLLRAAWNEDPLCTMKLVFQLGDPRWGKSDRDNHQLCLLWLWRHCPATVLANIRSGAMAEHTCLKGVLDLLMYAAWDDDDFIHQDLEAFPGRGTRNPKAAEKKTERFLQRKLQNPERRQRQALDRQDRISRFCQMLQLEGLAPDEIRRPRTFGDESVPKRMPWIDTQEWASEKIKERFRSFCEELDWAKNQQIHAEVKEMRKLRLQRVREKYVQDPVLQELYDTVAELFAAKLGELRDIMRRQKEGRPMLRDEKLKLTGSLYPKWAPSKDGMHDKKTDIVRGVVARLFPEQEFRLPDGTYDDYISFMKDKYRQEVLTPLRRSTEVVEASIGSQNWENVNYDRMPARCRLLYGQSVFAAHDHTRYEEHIQAAAEGKATIKGSVMPHELVDKVMAEVPTELELQEAEAQWRDLVAELADSGQLGRSLAVCDVSHSMYGLPIQAAVALALLISEVAQDPWRNRICAFSAEPKFIEIPEESLRARVQWVLHMNFGLNTDYERIFDEILKMAVQHHVPAEEMPQRLVVLSDMQFDESRSLGTTPWATTHQIIEEKFRLAGYLMPQIVYWNLRFSHARGTIPTPSLEKGVVMLGGFSAGLFKSFLKNQLEVPSPLEQLRAIVNTSYYEDVKVAPEDLRSLPPPHLADLLFSK